MDLKDDLKDIKAIIDLMRKNSVSEFELEKQDFKVRLKRGPNGGVTVTGVSDEVAGAGYPQPPAMVQPPVVVQQVPLAVPNEVEIKSPISLLLKLLSSRL